MFVLRWHRISEKRRKPGRRPLAAPAVAGGAARETLCSRPQPRRDPQAGACGARAPSRLRR